MGCQQHHSLYQGIDDKGVLRVLRVFETHRVTQFADPVLDLDAGIHLHEEMPVAINNALESGYGVQTHCGTKARRLLFHGIKGGNVLLQHRTGLLLTSLLCSLRRQDQ